MSDDKEVLKAKKILNDWVAAEHPWIHVTAQMHDHAMTLSRVPARKFYWDARAFINAMIEAVAYYGIDEMLPISTVYDFELEALGAKMIYSDNAMPTVDFQAPLVKEPADLLKLKTPNFLADARLPYALDCIKFSTEVGAQVGMFCSPLSMAVGLRSYTGLVKDMRRRPQFAHDLFSFIVDDVLVPFLDVQKQYCGVSVSLGNDAWAAIPNFSARELDEWVLKYNLKLSSAAKKVGVTVLHTSGTYIEERLEKFDAGLLRACLDHQVACSPDAPALFLYTGQYDYPVEPVREYTAKYRERGVKLPLTVVVNARLLRDGPKDKIVGSLRRFIDAFARDHEVTMFLGNIPADTPSEHVHAAIETVHSYGRKPIADNLDEVEFRLPERKPFPEWRRALVQDG